MRVVIVSTVVTPSPTRAGVAPLWLGLALSRIYVVFAIGILNTSCNFYLRLLYFIKTCLVWFSRQLYFFFCYSMLEETLFVILISRNGSMQLYGHTWVPTACRKKLFLPVWTPTAYCDRLVYRVETEKLKELKNWIRGSKKNSALKYSLVYNFYQKTYVQYVHLVWASDLILCINKRI